MAFGVWGRASLGALAAAMGIAALTPGCGKVAHGGGNGTENPAGLPIVVGASIGETGGLSGNTPALKGGIEVAQNQINAAGGVLGRPINFVIQDDQSDPTKSPGVLMSLQQAGALAVVGPGASSEVSADLPSLGYTGCTGDGGCSPPPASADGNNVLVVSATATSILLTENQKNQDGWFFRTVPNDSYQGKAVVQFARQGPGDGGVGCTNMALVYQQDQYGGPMASIIEAAFPATGGTIVGTPIGIPATTQSSYMTQALAIVMATPQPDCMVMVTFSETGAYLVRDVKAAIAATANPASWQSFFIIGTDGCYDPAFIKYGESSPGTPPSIVEGVYGTNANTAPIGSQYGYLKSLYESQIGFSMGQTDLDPYTSNMYDAAILVSLAIEQAGVQGNLTPDGIRRSMFSVSNGNGSASAQLLNASQIPQALQALSVGDVVNYDGASGNVDFTDSGDVVGGFIVWEVVSGQFETYRQIPASTL